MSYFISPVGFSRVIPRLPIPNRHVTGPGHNHRAPQKSR
jgi:hypothetical protein